MFIGWNECRSEEKSELLNSKLRGQNQWSEYRSTDGVAELLISLNPTRTAVPSLPLGSPSADSFYALKTKCVHGQLSRRRDVLWKNQRWLNSVPSYATLTTSHNSIPEVQDDDKYKHKSLIQNATMRLERESSYTTRVQLHSGETQIQVPYIRTVIVLVLQAHCFSHLSWLTPLTYRCQWSTGR